MGGKGGMEGVPLPTTARLQQGPPVCMAGVSFVISVRDGRELEPATKAVMRTDSPVVVIRPIWGRR